MTARLFLAETWMEPAPDPGVDPRWRALHSFVSRRAAIAGGLIVCALLYVVVFRPIETDFLAFELAWTEGAAGRAMGFARSGEIRIAIWWDFVFIGGYVVAFSGLCIRAGRQYDGTAAQELGYALVGAVVLAGALDVYQNAFQFASLSRYRSLATTLPTALLAAGKFALLGAAAAYLVVASMLGFVRRRTARRAGRQPARR